MLPGSVAGLDDLRRSLGTPAPVYVCVGEESLLVKEAVEAVREVVLAGGMAAFNHASFVCGEEAALGFADACRQVPVMSSRRLVELKQVQDGNKALMESLLAYVQKPIDSTVLLVSGMKMPAAIGGTDYGVRITNQVKKTGVVCKLDADGIDPAAFARSRAKPWNVTVDTAGVQKLIEYGGDDLDVLAGNLELCCGFVGSGGRITPEVVEEVCASTAAADVWRLTDAIVAADANGALAELHRLLEEGEAPHRLMANIAWQLRQVLLVQDAARRHLPDRESGVRMPPFKLRAVRERVERRPVSPSAWLEALATAARRMNSSRAGDRRVIEAFVLGLVVKA